MVHFMCIICAFNFINYYFIWIIYVIRIERNMNTIQKAEYGFYIKQKDNKIHTYIPYDCPIYDKKEGKCSECEFFKGLNPRVLKEGRCGVRIYAKPIEHFRVEQKCPKKEIEHGECYRCANFLGFNNNNMFFCRGMS